MDIRKEFGQRVRALRARCGVSQEWLAERSDLDRTYISSMERGERNVSLLNIERIAAALHVTIEYLFSDECLPVKPAYLKKDFEVPFEQRFKYHVDATNKVITFQVKGLLDGKSTDQLSASIIGACSAFGREELKIFVDHREMKARDGEPVAYSPEVTEHALRFQEQLSLYSKQIIVLCNSRYMVEQFNQTMKISGIYEKTSNLFGEDKEIIGKAYQMLDVNGNELIKTK